MHKVLMIERQTRKLAGIAVVKERRENGNNLLELHYFTVARKKSGDGARLMALLLRWAARKKLYSEIVAMADLNAVRFFYQQEFVLVDPKEFQRVRGVELEYYHTACMMHRRLPNFDRNRRDKLNIKSFDEYEPVSKAAVKMK